MRRTLEKFFGMYTRMELNNGAVERRIQLTPVLTVKDLLTFPQLVEREFWKQVEHPELGVSITYPGGFVKPEIGECGIRFRAPLIGEHNEDVFRGELAMPAQEFEI